MLSLFFIGLNPRYQSFSWLPQGLNVMYSAAGYWGDQGWRRDRYIKQAGLKWLDSGGFTMINKHGGYQFTTVEFMNLVAFLNPDYYASLDYPCEPEINRGDKFLTNWERIQATVVNAVEMANWEDHVSGSMVPVIQGYTLSEYCQCIDLHFEKGTIREYMAVGSMCRRISLVELHKLISGIFNYANQAGVKRLHWFGLKISPGLADLNEFIYSRDSAVVYDDYGKGSHNQRTNKRWPIGKVEKRIAFEKFLDRLDGLGLNYVTRSRFDVAGC